MAPPGTLVALSMPTIFRGVPKEEAEEEETTLLSLSARPHRARVDGADTDSTRFLRFVDFDCGSLRSWPQKGRFLLSYGAQFR